jgi:hypothetical protein
VPRISPSSLFVLPAILVGASLERGAGSAPPPSPARRTRGIHHSPGEELERIDVTLIGEAAKQIDMAAYADGPRWHRGVARGARGVKARIWRDASEAARLNEFDVEAQLGGPGPGPRASVKCARGRTDAPEGLLCGPSPPVRRLGQFQPVRRDAPGQ